jgi:hypothetical protein
VIVWEQVAQKMKFLSSSLSMSNIDFSFGSRVDAGGSLISLMVLALATQI